MPPRRQRRSVSRSVCAPHRRVYFTAKGGYTCYSTDTLRGMMRAVHDAASDDAKTMYRPYTRHGGAAENNDHRTRKGLIRTLREIPDGKDRSRRRRQRIQSEPEQWWPYEDSLHPSSHEWKETPSYPTMRSHFLPVFFNTTDADFDFDSSWLHDGVIYDVIKQNTRRKRSFLWGGVITGQDTRVSQRILKTHRVEFARNPKKLQLAFVYGSGDHWTALLVSKKTKTIDYYDSLGFPMPRALEKLIKDHLQTGMFRAYQLRAHETRHQAGNSTECGMYAVWYVTARASHVSFESIEEAYNPPENMCAKRREYFLDAPQHIRESMRKKPVVPQYKVQHDKNRTTLIIDDESD